MTVICPYCKGQNPNDKAFCGDCGKPLPAEDTREDRASEAVLRARIRSILKDELDDQKVVEIETAQAVLERLTAWGKLFAYFVAISAALFILTLVMLGISNYSDFSKLAKDATAQVQAHIGNLQKQSSKAEILAAKTDKLQAAYDTLKKRFTNTQALAARVEALAQKVSQLERVAFCKSPYQDIAQKLVPEFNKFQQYIAAMGYRASQDCDILLELVSQPWDIAPPRTRP